MTALFGRDSYLAELRYALALPRLVEKPKSDLHGRMAEHWCKHARDCGRPAYNESRGFTPDRRMLRDPTPLHTVSICGDEKSYGPFSRVHWRYIRLAMREAFLAEWHRQLGTTYETTEGGRRPMAICAGLTA